MVMLRRFYNWIMLAEPDLVLARAQFNELRRQIPLLYALLIVNGSALAWTHLGHAPHYLTIGALAPMMLICTVRMITWWRRSDVLMTDEQVLTHLRRTTILAGVLSIGFVSWAISLDAYGGPFEQGHVALFIAITVIGCIFCLSHLPQAATLVMTIVTVPYLVHYFGSGNMVFAAMALNIFAVSLVMARVLTNSFGAFVGYVNFQTALESKHVEAERLGNENARLANTDALTGLPNRRHFFSSLDLWLNTSAQKGPFAVAAIDLDHFKPVNDTYGHQLGDRLLAEIGVRIAGLNTESLVIARIGGDEFGLLIRGDEDLARQVCQDLCDTISAPYLLDGVVLQIGCSAGVAAYPEAGRTAHALFDHSDYALYESKRLSRGEVTLYCSEHEHRLRCEQAIEAALLGNQIETELSVAFQPVVDVTTGKTVSMEALARWNSSELGPIPPSDFIAAAERLGLVNKLTLVLFKKTLHDASLFPDEVGVAFNLSPQDIISRQTVLALVAAIETSAIAPRRITFELTETAVMQDFEAAEEAINLLRNLGTRIALDDFGTGYSSLSYVSRLPIDVIKIDRSFVEKIHTVTGRKIVSTILALSENLKLTCIVEGVETAHQLKALGALGCRFYQGYYFSRPVPVAEAVADLNHDERKLA